MQRHFLAGAAWARLTVLVDVLGQVAEGPSESGALDSGPAEGEAEGGEFRTWATDSRESVALIPLIVWVGEI